ncbi:hypothetical protein T484DRAFT_1946817 [Baffinella frigidus]|nr:hypothetical protein T484DRAFT_1946817 [Cryptophyta sp. CCMP2293]
MARGGVTLESIADGTAPLPTGPEFSGGKEEWTEEELLDKGFNWEATVAVVEQELDEILRLLKETGPRPSGPDYGVPLLESPDGMPPEDEGGWDDDDGEDDMPDFLGEVTDEERFFIEEAATLIEENGGEMSHLAFGFRWKKKFPTRPWKPFLQKRFTHGASVARFLTDTTGRVDVESSWVGGEGSGKPRQVSTFRVVPRVSKEDAAERKRAAKAGEKARGEGWVMFENPDDDEEERDLVNLTDYRKALEELDDEMTKLQDVVSAILWRRFLE